MITALVIVLSCRHSTASPAPAAADQASADERTQHVVDARVVARTRSSGKVTFVIGLPKALGPGVVDDNWTGTFTSNGKEIPGSNFKLTVAKGWDVRAEIAADALPSATVRLFPPGYTH